MCALGARLEGREAALALVGLQFAWGVGSVGWLLSRQSFLTRTVEPAVRGRAMSLFGGTTRLAYLIGPLLGGWTADRFGFAAAFWTTAGVTAGIDLSLLMIEEDFGKRHAIDVAKYLVVYLRRAGGQSQFSEMLQSQMNDGDTFAGFHVWLTENLRREDLDVETLARQANMSARNFSRVYKQKTGRSPAKALEVFRLEAARRLLEDSDRSISQIACACGFGDEERMRVTFQRHLAISPRDYRVRFSR